LTSVSLCLCGSSIEFVKIHVDSCSSASLPTEPLFPPRVAVHVVAVLFPEARGVVGAQLDDTDPFGAFPEVEPGDESTERVAVVGGERLAVPGALDGCGAPIPRGLMP
jgi:hypothetical protein